MVNLPEEIEPSYYKEFIYIDRRINKCMYSEDNKSIYITIEVYLLFWTKLSKILEDMG